MIPSHIKRFSLTYVKPIKSFNLTSLVVNRLLDEMTKSFAQQMVSKPSVKSYECYVAGGIVHGC